jgi:hypothetical protein
VDRTVLGVRGLGNGLERFCRYGTTGFCVERRLSVRRRMFRELAEEKWELAQELGARTGCTARLLQTYSHTYPELLTAFVDENICILTINLL